MVQFPLRLWMSIGVPKLRHFGWEHSVVTFICILLILHRFLYHPLIWQFLGSLFLFVAISDAYVKLRTTVLNGRHELRFCFQLIILWGNHGFRTIHHLFGLLCCSRTKLNVFCIETWTSLRFFVAQGEAHKHTLEVPKLHPWHWYVRNVPWNLDLALIIVSIELTSMQVFIG